MASQIKSLTKAAVLLTKSLANKENKLSNRPNGGYREAKQYTKPQSMGCYCWLHRFHPAGVNHTVIGHVIWKDILAIIAKKARLAKC
jgi:hypothetical protein